MDSPSGLVSRQTLTMPTTVFRNESQNVLDMALSTKILKQMATQYAKAKGLDIKASRKDGFLTLVDFTKFDVDNGTNHTEALIDNYLSSSFFTDRVAETMGLYIVINEFLDGEIRKLGEKDHTGGTAGETMPNLGGMPLLRTKVTNPNVRFVFTPEHLNIMLSALRNNKTFQSAENAMLANLEMGAERSLASELQSLHSEEYYNNQRQQIADTTDVLMALTSEAGGELVTIENTRMQDEIGLPLIAYDSLYYLRDETHDGLTGKDSIFANKIKKAIVEMEVRSSPIYIRPEITLLKEVIDLVQEGEVDVATIVILMSHAGDNPNMQKKVLTEHFRGHKYNAKDIEIMVATYSKYATAYSAAMIRPHEQSNPFYFAAQAAIERFAPDSKNALRALVDK